MEEFQAKIEADERSKSKQREKMGSLFAKIA